MLTGKLDNRAVREMDTFLLGILGGISAWFGTMLIGQPLYTFFGVREEIAKQLYFRISGPTNIHTVLADFEGHYRIEFGELAGRLIAFTSTQPLADKIVRFFGYRPAEAASALVKAASGGQHGSAVLLRQIASDLKIKLP